MEAAWQRVCEETDGRPDLPLAELEARLSGLPDAVRVAPRRWARALLAGEAPRGLALCRSLVFAGERVPAERLVELARSPLLRDLTELRLLDAGLDDDAARAFAGACGLESLRALYLPWNALTAAGLLPILRALPRLTTLHLYKNRLGPDGVRGLVDAAPPLQYLNVCFNGLGPQGARVLAASPLRVETLHIGINALGDEGVEALASGFPGLVELNARANGFSADGLAALSRGPAWSTLQRLLIEDNALGRQGAAVLAAAPAGPLRVLQLGDAGVGDSGARLLANAAALRGLTDVTLSHNGLGDEGIEAVVSAPFARSLERLDVSENRFGERGARLLAGLSDLSALRS